MTVIERESDTYNVRTNFEVTDKMRSLAKKLAYKRSDDGNVATGDRGRDKQKQIEDSITGLLGEIVAALAFKNAPVSVEFGDGIESDIKFSFNGSDEEIDVEVKTRHHKSNIPNSQRDMFLRKHPSEHDVDMFMLVKVYPDIDGVYDTGELIGFTLPKHASDNAIQRDDIADYTNKYMVPVDEMNTNWDVFVELLRKMGNR